MSDQTNSPNKIFICTGSTDASARGGVVAWSALVAASSQDVAIEHMKSYSGPGFDTVHIPGGAYKAIYSQDGEGLEPIQAKVLYITTHFSKNNQNET